MNNPLIFIHKKVFYILHVMNNHKLLVIQA